jgi:hypothetical protein
MGGLLLLVLAVVVDAVRGVLWVVSTGRNRLDIWSVRGGRLGLTNLSIKTPLPPFPSILQLVQAHPHPPPLQPLPIPLH